MKISNYNDEKSILAELGNRIQQYRISLNITQSELAQRCGLSLKTIARTEIGYDTKLSNLIKILMIPLLVYTYSAGYQVLPGWFFSSEY